MLCNVAARTVGYNVRNPYVDGARSSVSRLNIASRFGEYFRSFDISNAASRVSRRILFCLIVSLAARLSACP